MKEESIRPFLNKRVLIILKNKFSYTGKITYVSEDTISFVDRFDKNLLISIDKISEIIEK